MASPPVADWPGLGVPGPTVAVVRGGATSHGFAMNVDPDLSVFRQFVACGLPDVAVTSLAS